MTETLLVAGATVLAMGTATLMWFWLGPYTSAHTVYPEAAREARAALDDGVEGHHAVFRDLAAGRGPYARAGLYLRQQAKRALRAHRRAARATWERWDHHPVCARCWVRWESAVPRGAHGRWAHPGCPRCRSTLDAHPGEVREILALLVEGEPEGGGFSSGTYSFNWLAHRDRLDFERVRIHHASDVDVEALVVAVENDPDEERRERHSSTPVEVARDGELSPNTLEMLRRTFGTITRID